MPAVADYFSKGLCGTYGADIPQQYAEDLRNVRIKNGVTLPRYGYRSVSAQSGAACKALASNNGNLYSVQGGHLWSVNVTTGVQTDLGAVGGSTVASVEVYGQYTVIFTDAQPYVYNGFGLSPVTTYVKQAQTDFIFGDASGRLKRAETFTSHASAFNFLNTTWSVKKVGAPVDNLSANIYAVSGGVPTTLVLSCTPVAGGTLTTSYVSTTFNYVSTPGTPSTTYAVVFERSGADDAANYYVIQGIGVGGITNAQACVHNGGTWFADGSNAIVGSLNGTALISSDSNPRFGKSFLNFLWAAGGNSGSFSKRNILYISRPATAVAPELCFDWTGSGSDAMVMKADVVGMAATLDRLFVFQEGRIDWLGKSSYVTIGGVTTFYPSSLSMGDTLASKDAAIVAGDKVIFLTSQLRVKTIGYALGVDQPEIGSLSEDPQVGIQKWMDENLHADQSACYGWYDDQRKMAKFHVRSKASPYNDLVLSWDLSNTTFVVDSNKFFGSSARHLGNFYCGSCIDGEVYQDEYGEDDDGLDISGYRNGCKMALGEQGSYKVWSGTKTSGTIRSGTTLQQTTVADGNAVDFCDIAFDAPTLTGAAVGSFSVGEAPIAGPLSAPNVKAFLKERGAGYVNAIAKRLGVDVTFSGSGMFFSLDALATKEKATKYVELSEMAPIAQATPTPSGALVDVDNNFITVIF